MLLDLVPRNVRHNLERLWLKAQSEGVDGGEATSEAIENLERYQKNLSECKL